MDGADAGGKPARPDNDVIADRDTARQHGAGDDRAGARQRERAIDGEAEAAARRAAGPCGRGLEQLRAQPGDARAGRARHRDHRRAAQRRRRQQVGNLVAHLGETIGIHQVRLGDGHRAVADAEQVDDRQMLDGLRHHPVIGGDHQQHEIDSGGARQHVVDEALVPRHIDEAEDAAVRHRQVGKAEIDRNAARLLLLEAIGIDAGKRPHQRGLAVIDMARGPDDHATCSGNGRSASALARSISAADSDAKVGWMKESASGLAPARARSSHIRAATPSRGTPAPS